MKFAIQVTEFKVENFYQGFSITKLKAKLICYVLNLGTWHNYYYYYTFQYFLLMLTDIRFIIFMMTSSPIQKSPSLSVLRDSSRPLPALLFNCQVGVGRTNLGLILGALVFHHLHRTPCNTRWGNFYQYVQCYLYHLLCL